jgi:predicted kinase
MSFVMVGGVPGAGKSTLLRRYRELPEVRVVDPDTLRPLLRWRPLVHLAHQALVWAAVLAGPAIVGTLLIQDTATRRRRREALLRAALWRGWTTHVVLIDVEREQALAGQEHRGRVSPARAFDRHWRRWTQLRADLAQVGVRPLVVTRAEAAEVLAELVRPTGPEAPGTPGAAAAAPDGKAVASLSA